MNVIINVLSCRVIVIIIIIIVLLYCLILQNNIEMTILTFMNVDGAFILAETRRKTSVLLFVDSRFINDSDEFGKMFVTRIALAHAFKKTDKNVTDQLTSNNVLEQIFLAFCTLNPDATSCAACLNSITCNPCMY